MRKLTVVTAAYGIAAGFSIIGSCSSVFAAESGAQTKPSDARVADVDEVSPANGGNVELRANVIQLQVAPKPGESPKVIRAEGAEGQPVIIRIVEGGATATPAEKENESEGDIARRLRERRRAEEARKPGQGGLRLGAAGQPENPKPGSSPVNVFWGTALGKAEKVTFLGIETSPAPEVLTHQLRLPADFGLVVDEVTPESPAAKAGLKQFDVLRKLDDQLLVDVRQLTALVRSHKSGDTVALTVIREGKSLTVNAALGEREEAAGEEGAGENSFQLRLRPGAGNPQAQEELEKRIREFRALPSPPAALAPGGWNARPLPGQPLPGARLEAPKPENPKPGQPNPWVPPGRVAPAEPGNARVDEARQLEQELRTLRATAEELRAQLKAREKEDAESPKGREQGDTGTADREKKDGGTRR